MPLPAGVDPSCLASSRFPPFLPSLPRCTGMAMGTGSALGHRAVDAVLGSRHPEPAAATEAAQQLVAENAPCSEQAKAFAECMSYSGGDMGPCQQYFDAMQQCRLNLQH